MIFDKKSRRAFLQGAGGTLVAIPFLDSIASKAYAAEAAPQNKRRFVALYMGHGQPNEHFYPAPTVKMDMQDASANPPGTGLPFQNLADNVRSIGLDALTNNGTTALSTIFNADISRHYDKILFARGFGASMGMADHYAAKMLTGIYDASATAHMKNSSIDQLMAQSPKVYASEPHFRSLQFHPGRSIFHIDTLAIKRTLAGNFEAVPAALTPAAYYQQIVRQVLLPGDRSRDATIVSEGQILNTVGEDIRRVLNNPRLSAADRRFFESYLANIRALETRLQTLQPIVCEPASGCSFQGGYANAAGPVACDQMLELSAIALRLGLTKIVTGQMHDGQGTHGESHYRYGPGGDAAMQTSLNAGKSWFSSTAKFLDLLDQPESDGSGRTCLDNTLVYIGSCMGNIGNHFSDELPVILAGAKDWLNAGKFIDYRSASKPFSIMGQYEVDARQYFQGRPINEVLIACMKWMGLGPEDWESERGATGFGSYVNTKGLDFGDRRSAPPFFVKA